MDFSKGVKMKDPDVEQSFIQQGQLLIDFMMRITVLERLLVKNGLVTEEQLREMSKEVGLEMSVVVRQALGTQKEKKD
jgi:hypothetical protein